MAEDGKKHLKIEHISEKVNEGWEKKHSLHQFILSIQKRIVFFGNR